MKLIAEAIIFDMDGVLVNVTSSYREAIKKTMATVLNEQYAIQRKVTDAPIEILKSIPGFNNDWDLSFALINLMNQDIPDSDYRSRVKLVTAENRSAEMYQRTKDLFQAFYLGKELYESVYNRPCPVSALNGLITNETLLINRDILMQLKSRFSLAIATSRPRFEALYALSNLQLLPSLFTEHMLVAQEDAAREKPFPDPLLEAKKRIQKEKCLYVGDTINDITAAREAGMKSIFIGEQALGDYQLSDINDLPTIL